MQQDVPRRQVPPRDALQHGRQRRVADLAARVERLDKAMQAQSSPELAGRIDALDRATRMQAAATAELATRIEALDKAGQTRAAFAAFMKSEIAKWTQVARAAGAKAD